MCLLTSFEYKTGETLPGWFKKWVIYFKNPKDKFLRLAVRDELTFVMELKGIEKEVIEQRGRGGAWCDFQLQGSGGFLPFSVKPRRKA